MLSHIKDLPYVQEVLILSILRLVIKHRIPCMLSISALYSSPQSLFQTMTTAFFPPLFVCFHPYALATSVSISILIFRSPLPDLICSFSFFVFAQIPPTFIVHLLPSFSPSASLLHLYHDISVYPLFTFISISLPTHLSIFTILRHLHLSMSPSPSIVHLRSVYH